MMTVERDVSADGDLEIELCGERLVLLPERAAYRPSDRSLLVADPHFGKAAAFRAHGLPVPGVWRGPWLMDCATGSRTRHISIDRSVSRTPDPMRIAFILVLLLTAFARPAWSQDAQAQPTLPGIPALPASLTPVDAPASADPVSLDLRRNHGLGAMIGATVGAVVGALVGHRVVCTENSGEGDVQGICGLLGVGLGVMVGALMGGLIGVPVKGSGR